MGCQISKGDFFFLSRVLFALFFFCFMDLKLTPFSFCSFLFACRMTRGHKEVSTSQAGSRGGTPRKRLLQEV